MDISLVQRKLELGEKLKIKYRYPCQSNGSREHYAVRSDRLVDVSPDLNRLYTRFRGATPIWVEVDEVIDITPDDGAYEEFPEG